MASVREQFDVLREGHFSVTPLGRDTMFVCFAQRHPDKDLVVLLNDEADTLEISADSFFAMHPNFIHAVTLQSARVKFTRQQR